MTMHDDGLRTRLVPVARPSQIPVMNIGARTAADIGSSSPHLARDRRGHALPERREDEGRCRTPGPQRSGRASRSDGTGSRPRERERERERERHRSSRCWRAVRSRAPSERAAAGEVTGRERAIRSARARRGEPLRRARLTRRHPLPALAATLSLGHRSGEPDPGVRPPAAVHDPEHRLGRRDRVRAVRCTAATC